LLLLLSAVVVVFVVSVFVANAF